MKKAKLLIGLTFLAGGLMTLGVGTVSMDRDITQEQTAITTKIASMEEIFKKVESETIDIPEPKEKTTVTPAASRVSEYDNHGILTLPDYDTDYKALITAGDTTEEISGALAVDYYPEGSMPGEKGNYLLAGHYGYKGQGKFHNLSKVENGDNVSVETVEGTYTYVITGRDVVSPEDTRVLAPTPNRPGVTPTKSYITLTTCYYEGIAKKRLAVWGELASFEPR